jgi:hypothetical protein
MYKGGNMDFQDFFEDLSSFGDYNVTFATNRECDGGVIYAVRVAVNGVVKGALSYENELDALSLAMDLVNRENASEHSHAANVLKATLDELGFDKAVALLERLNTLEVENG